MTPGLGIEILGSVIAGLLVLVIAGLAKWLPKLYHELKAGQTNLAHRLDLQDIQLENIVHETHTNTGASLKDAVIRTEGAVAQNTEALTQHLTDAGYQQRRLDEHLRDCQMPSRR